jgi:hypothetical protein
MERIHNWVHPTLHYVTASQHIVYATKQNLEIVYNMLNDNFVTCLLTACITHMTHLCYSISILNNVVVCLFQFSGVTKSPGIYFAHSLW